MYRRDDGDAIAPEEMERIARLRIPPAWTDVWVCADARGHLQATGRDARGRKQYRYHAEWVRGRSEDKFGRLEGFGRSLSRIRRRVAADLARDALDQAHALAVAVSLLDETLVRVGSTRYRDLHDSYGLTTLTTSHVAVDGESVSLRFRGKAGRDIALSLSDARIASAMRRMSELPGQDLFRWVDEGGGVHAIGSSDVNAYLREAAGTAVTSKDFRTWGGSRAATEVLVSADGGPSERTVSEAIRAAAGLLHNTPAVCRKSYVHPGIVELYRSGCLGESWSEARAAAQSLPRLNVTERTFLALVSRL